MAELAAYVEYVVPRTSGSEETPRNARVDQNMTMRVRCNEHRSYIGVADEQMVTVDGPGGRGGRHEAAADQRLAKDRTGRACHMDWLMQS